MKLYVGLVLALSLGCGKLRPKDQRDFASGKFSNDGSSNYEGEKDAQEADAGGEVLAEDVSPESLEDMLGGKENPDKGKGEPNEPNPPKNDPNKPQDGKTPPPGKSPDLPPELKAKLAKCYAQWEKVVWEKDTLIDIREFNLDLDRLKASDIQLAGSKPEVVFVNIRAAKSIEKVSLALDNKKGLYCVDIDAGKDIEHLEVTYQCGAKIGIVDINADKAKKLSIKEVCDP